MAKLVLEVFLIDMETSNKLSTIRCTELIRRPHGASGQVEIDKKIEGIDTGKAHLENETGRESEYAQTVA